jgi:hypothetical protein
MPRRCAVKRPFAATRYSQQEMTLLTTAISYHFCSVARSFAHNRMLLHRNFKFVIGACLSLLHQLNLFIVHRRRQLSELFSVTFAHFAYHRVHSAKAFDSRSCPFLSSSPPSMPRLTLILTFSRLHSSSSNLYLLFLLTHRLFEIHSCM